MRFYATNEILCYQRSILEMGGLPAIAIVIVTERQLGKRQPYHRRVVFWVEFP